MGAHSRYGWVDRYRLCCGPMILQWGPLMGAHSRYGWFDRHRLCCGPTILQWSLLMGVGNYHLTAEFGGGCGVGG